MNDYIEVIGAREHNLKNVHVKIPRNKLVVVTGISGSGKSSLVFDTIYAEGQRRYMESFSSYARSFIGNLKRPDVDKIDGLSPVIAIEQKTTSRNPRSTVGTTTEIYDFLRLLFARAGTAYSYLTGNRMVKQTEDQVIDKIISQFLGKKITLLAPLIRGRKGHYREEFQKIRKMGYTKARVDGLLIDLDERTEVDRYKIHDIEVVVDRIIPSDSDRYRLSQSVRTCFQLGKGVLMVLPTDDNTEKPQYFSKTLMDPQTGLSYDDPAPNLFSFNSPYGWCTVCEGLGIERHITIDSIIPDPSKSISQGAIAPIGAWRDVWIFNILDAILKSKKQSLTTPFQMLPPDVVQIILYGSEETFKVKSKSGVLDTWNSKFEGIMNWLNRHQSEGSEKTQEWIAEYAKEETCTACKGLRLNPVALSFKIHDKNIAELCALTLRELTLWFSELEVHLEEKQKMIASEITKEIRKRLHFLNEVGLEYLTLNRNIKTLSGGETQRIRLATQVGTQLVGVLYILDEPSIGLHQRDNQKLINSLKNLRDTGNTVIVVEHDKDMMLASDYIIDVGPGAGRHGGQIVCEGSPKDFLQKKSTTAKYLANKITIPEVRNSSLCESKKMVLYGASGNNLKNITVEFPLGKLIVVTGVSGSGKSTLIHETLYPILNKHFYGSKKMPLPYTALEGLTYIDKVIEIDQSPIGRTPRSNPATYTGVFTDIRNLFAQLPQSKIRGYTAGRFSFNVKGGRCETCEGGGLRVIEMEFLPDVQVVCESCKGKRYNKETLEITFKGKSISDVLDMTVEQAVSFFENQPKILRYMQTLHSVGLGYITIGQHATTLSGGEAQRVKLATELVKKDTGKTFYILDEPTTGLHFQDIELLMKLLRQLVDKGNTVLIIEHNMDVIKMADWIIDIGPDSADKGGEIVCEGSPNEIIKNTRSHTARFLRYELESH